MVFFLIDVRNLHGLLGITDNGVMGAVIHGLSLVTLNIVKFGLNLKIFLEAE